jgi:hypothetical protein
MLNDRFFNELKKNLQMEKIASPGTNANDALKTSKLQVAQMIGELIKIAQELDSIGSTKAADLVDMVLDKLTNASHKE